MVWDGVDYWRIGRLAPNPSSIGIEEQPCSAFDFPFSWVNAQDPYHHPSFPCLHSSNGVVARASEQFQHFHKTKAISMVAAPFLDGAGPQKQSFTQHIERMALQHKSLMIVGSPCNLTHKLWCWAVLLFSRYQIRLRRWLMRFLSSRYSHYSLPYTLFEVLSFFSASLLLGLFYKSSLLHGWENSRLLHKFRMELRKEDLIENPWKKYSDHFSTQSCQYWPRNFRLLSMLLQRN